MSSIDDDPQELSDEQKIDTAHDYLLQLGRMSVEFATVKRAPRYSDGSRESDVEHSFHLALTAIEMANLLYPQLDRGLISQFSLVHDLPEIYTGDVWTFSISEEEMARKKEAEAVATERLLGELPEYTADLLRRYEEQREPEARFVRYIDKLLPLVINIVVGDKSTFLEDYDISDIASLEAKREENTARFKEHFPEFTLIHDLLARVAKTSTAQFFPEQ